MEIEENISKCNENLQSSSDLISNILSSLQTRTTDPLSLPETLQKLAQIEEENQALTAKLKQIEISKLEAINLLKNSKTTDLTNEIIEILSKDPDKIALEVQQRLDLLSEQNKKLKLSQRILNFQREEALDSAENLHSVLKDTGNDVYIENSSELVRKLQPIFNEEETLDIEIKRLKEGLINKDQEIERILIENKENTQKLDFTKNHIKHHLEVLSNPLKPNSEKLYSLTKMKDFYINELGGNDHTDSSTEPYRKKDDNPYTQLNEKIMEIEKDINEVKGCLKEESLEENEEKIKEVMEVEGMCLEGVKENFDQIKTIFNYFYNGFSDGISTFQEINKAGDNDEYDKLLENFLKIQENLLFNQNQLLEPNENLIKSMQNTLKTAIEQLTNPKSSNKMKQLAIEALKNLLPSDIIRSEGSDEEDDIENIPKIFKKKGPNRHMSIMEGKALKFTAKMIGNDMDDEDERGVDYVTSPRKANRSLTKRDESPSKLPIELKYEGFIKTLEDIERSDETQRALLESLTKDNKQKLAILMSDDATELEKKAALKGLLKNLAKIEDIQKEMKLKGSEQKVLLKSLKEELGDFEILRKELEKLKKDKRLEELLRKEGQIKLKITANLLEQSNEKLRNLEADFLSITEKFNRISKVLLDQESSLEEKERALKEIGEIGGELNGLKGRFNEMKEKLEDTQTRLEQTTESLRDTENNLSKYLIYIYKYINYNNFLPKRLDED